MRKLRRSFVKGGKYTYTRKNKSCYQVSLPTNHHIPRDSYIYIPSLEEQKEKILLIIVDKTQAKFLKLHIYIIKFYLFFYTLTGSCIKSYNNKTNSTYFHIWQITFSVSGYIFVKRT